MFVDASTIIAVLTYESEKEFFELTLKNAEEIVTSPVAIYEAALGVARKLSCSVRQAQLAVSDFLKEAEAEIAVIDEKIGVEALAAFEKFGKGRHRAALNMGDCFAYACAKSRNVPLLFKGDDFIHTDIRIA
ncbi:MAG: type II toxin-antitoxin system VapC family toxin [Hyphomicrobiales bacterium]